MNDWNKWEPELYKACLAQGMVRVREYTFTKGDYYLWVVAKPSSAVFRELGWQKPGEAHGASPAKAAGRTSQA